MRKWRRVAVTSQGQTEWPPCVAAADRCVALATTAAKPGGGCVAAECPERQRRVDESQAARSRRASQFFTLKMASTSSLFPDELIIRHVRNHSCLYDPRETEYKDADRKAAVWREIANAVGMSGKWHTFSIFYRVASTTVMHPPLSEIRFRALWLVVEGGSLPGRTHA